MPVGDIGIMGINLADNQILLRLEVETLTVRFVDGDEYVTTFNPLRFYAVDTRTVRSGRIRGFDFGSDLALEYIGTDPDNPDWVTITGGLKRFFRDDALGGGWAPI